MELDHLFICLSRGAPEADALVEFGLHEGPPNTHPGQGTANRRFFFRNAMLELLWVEHPLEAQNEQTAPTLLWERWTGRQSGACPFGIVFRPGVSSEQQPPFPARTYKPGWLPPDLVIYFSPAGLEEPMWLFLPYLEGDLYAPRFVPHPNGAREITGLRLVSPVPFQSPAAQALTVSDGPEYLAILELDEGVRQESADFRPHLPLVIAR